MIRTLTLAAFAVAVGTVAVSRAEEKKTMLTVSFSTPNPTWKAAISEVREVGDELWVKVEASSPGGIAPQVIGTAKASLTIDTPTPKGGIKYVVFGKKWGWKNKEEGVVFLADLEEKERASMEKKYDEGKVVYPVKK